MVSKESFAKRDVISKEQSYFMMKRSVNSKKFALAHYRDLFPNICDTATYILTHLFAEGRCLACEAEFAQGTA